MDGLLKLTIGIILLIISVVVISCSSNKYVPDSDAIIKYSGPISILVGTYEKNCPICEKSDKLIPFLYSKPTKKSFDLAREGKVILGGCIIREGSPNYRCSRDLVDFKLTDSNHN